MHYPIPTTILLNGGTAAVGGAWPELDLRTLSAEAGQVLRLGLDGGLLLTLDPVDNLIEFDPVTGHLSVSNPTFASLADVDQAGRAAGDAVIWDGANYVARTLGLGDMSDVNLTTAATDGQTIVYDAVAGEFVPGDFPAYDRDDTDTVQLLLSAGNVFTANVRIDGTTPGGNLLVSSAEGLRVAPLATTDLIDFSATAATAGQVPMWDPVAGEYVPATINDTDTTYNRADTDTVQLLLSATNVFTADVRIDGVTVGGNWLTSSPSGLRVAPQGLGDLTDVNLTVAPTDGQAITFDAATSEWVATDLVGTTYTRDDTATVELLLSAGNEFTANVRIDGVTAGGNWLTSSVEGLRVAPQSIGNLTDVDLTTAPTNGQALLWNGTSFAPTDLPADTDTTYGRDNTDTVELLLSGANVFTANVRLDGVAATNLLTSSAEGLLVAPTSIGVATDVDLTTAPTNGQVLAWNGTNFAPITVGAVASNTSTLLKGGDTVPSGVTILDVDGNTLNAGDTVPDGNLIHYVLDAGGTLVSQNALFIEACCVTQTRCDSGNGNATVLEVIEIRNGAVQGITRLNTDLTAFAGNVVDLVDCTSNLGDLGNVAVGAAVDGQVLGLVGGVWGPVTPVDTDTTYTGGANVDLVGTEFSVADALFRTSGTLVGEDGDVVPAGLTLNDADGNPLNAGDAVPDGHVIHYVVDAAGALVSQKAIFLPACCYQQTLCDSGNGNAEVLVLSQLRSGAVVSTDRFNLPDLTPFAGNVADLVDCAAGVAVVANLNDLADVVAAAPNVGEALIWNGTEWAPGAAGGGAVDNLFTANLTQTADRTHADGGFDFTMTGSGDKTLSSVDGADTAFLTVAPGIVTASGSDGTNGAQVIIDGNGIDLVFAGTGDLEVDGDPGTADQVLTSNGPDAAPTWETPSYKTRAEPAWGYPTDGDIDPALPAPANVPDVRPYSVVTATATGTAELLRFSVTVEDAYTNASPPVGPAGVTHDGATWDIFVGPAGAPVTNAGTLTLPANATTATLALTQALANGDVVLPVLTSTGATAPTDVVLSALIEYTEI